MRLNRRLVAGGSVAEKARRGEDVPHLFFLWAAALI